MTEIALQRADVVVLHHANLVRGSNELAAWGPALHALSDSLQQHDSMFVPQDVAGTKPITGLRICAWPLAG